MLDPVGFWSYARHDDNHSDGQLSQLRTIVGKAIALQYGEEVTLWQDIAAIPFGVDWAATIERTIGQTTFFIPIVTPRFLRSQYCFDEFMAFRRRMLALDRDDLIFPVQYVDVKKVQATETVFGENLTILRRPQWTDFVPLFYADPRSPEVRKWAGTLAEHILDAMRRVAPAIPIIKPPIRDQQSSPSAPTDRGSEETARLRRLAEQGDAAAQCNLGFMYQWGRGVEQNQREAVAWYRKAAEQGHAGGQCKLGTMYAWGWGVEKNERAAVAWYRKAAEQGDAGGQCELGEMYANGRGVEKNEREAVAWYRKAAEQGFADGQYNLGEMYLWGRGDEKKDREAAVAWYRKAAEQGHQIAQLALKRLRAG